jgi:predicted nucleotide-binding protein
VTFLRCTGPNGLLKRMYAKLQFVDRTALKVYAAAKGVTVSHRVTIFIGSSSEGVHVAKALERGLADDADVTMWKRDIFQPSYGYLESLTKMLESSDFAVLVLTADDLIQSRGPKSRAPRDNVVFELGLFIGRLGRQRCFFLCDKTKRIKVPTDQMPIPMKRS